MPEDDTRKAFDELSDEELLPWSDELDRLDLDHCWDQLKPVQFEIASKRRRLLVLPPDVAEALERLAESQSLTPTALAERWLREKLAEA